MLLENLTLTTSEESKVQEKIRVSFLRNRGNVSKVVKEVKLPEEYVVKALEKFRKAYKSEANRLISDNILTHLLFGYHSRVEHLMEIISKLENVEKIKRSTCCQKAVRPLEKADDQGRQAYECLECGNETQMIELLNEEALSQKMTAIDMLRKEDSEMCRFAEKLGYTIKDSTPPVINNTQNILVMPGQNGQIDMEKVQELEKLKPIEQEALRQRIEKELSEAELIEDNG